MTINIDSLSDLPGAAVQFLEEYGHRKIFAFKAEMGNGKTTFITALLKKLPCCIQLNNYEVLIYQLYVINMSDTCM